MTSNHDRFQQSDKAEWYLKHLNTSQTVKIHVLNLAHLFVPLSDHVLKLGLLGTVIFPNSASIVTHCQYYYLWLSIPHLLLSTYYTLTHE